jgi:hypothetical protein
VYAVLSLSTIWLSLRPLGSFPEINENVTGPTLDVAVRGMFKVTRSVNVPKLPAGVIHEIVIQFMFR